MIRHIVLLRFKQDIIHKEIEGIFVALAELKNVIPQIKQFSYGVCNSKENLDQGFTHGFTMDFADEVARDFYVDHPKHKQVAEQIGVFLENGLSSVVVFDYTL
ncbi:MAG: Dabb family protein [bacterium]|nr:Dabb family protein [bacterium]